MRVLAGNTRTVPVAAVAMKLPSIDVRSLRSRIIQQWSVGGGSPLFSLVGGLLAGVLIAAIVIPDHQGSGPLGVSSGSASAGAPTGADDRRAAGPGAPGADEPVGPGGATGPSSGSVDAVRGGDPARSADAAGPAAEAPATAGTARGVSADRIKIGVALLDLGAVRQLGPAFDNGDRRAHFESILAGWRDAGLLPVAGRDIEFVYRTYGVLSQEEQRAACVGLIQDEGVFAVLGDSRFQEAGEECVAREFRTPMIGHDAGGDDLFARAAPFLFTVQTSEDRLLRNLVHWADRKGLLDGRRIGIYHLDEPLIRDQMDRTIVAELQRLGHDLAARATTDQDLGGPRDALAVQRFRSAGVDVALLFTSKAGFMQQAEAQGYQPSYLESDYISGTTNTATSTYPPSHFDGAWGMTALRYGEWKAGIPAPAEAEACARTYERHGGAAVDPDAREAEWIALNKACDVARLLIRGLQGAGRALDTSSLVTALQGLRDVPMGIAPPVSFEPGRQHGVTHHRSVRWSADCSCWKASGEFAPLPVR